MRTDKTNCINAESSVDFPEALPFNPIPTESNRPCFAVLDDCFTTSDGTEYRAGVWYFGFNARKGDDTPTQTWVCTPLHIEALTHDHSHNNYGRLLRFSTGSHKKWRQWAMPMEILKGDGTELRGALLSMGVQLNPNLQAKNMLMSYLQGKPPSKHMLCVMRTGWSDSKCNAFALPDGVIGPNFKNVTFQAASPHGDEYSQRGTLEEWTKEIAAAAIGNPVLALGLCSAFTGPLLKLLNAESGGLHLIGESSTGKTTVLLAACSVWGGENYRRSWRATANGLEGIASLYNDSLLVVDEISECDPRDVGAVVYMFGNGQGKQRANRAGAACNVARWSYCVLSTGERSIESSMEDGGIRIKAGQSVRLLDIPVQRTYGAWDNLQSHASGPLFSDSIKSSSKQYFGTPGRAFLEKLTRDDPMSFAKRVEEIKAQLLEMYPGGDGQFSRAATRLAVIALAGELATEYGITGWPQEEATNAVTVAFEAWVSQRDNVASNIEKDQALQSVRRFIQRHGDSRFSDSREACQRVHDRAGWYEVTDNGVKYYFTPEGLREALKGQDFKRGLKNLTLAGVLIDGHDGRSSHVKRFNSRNERVYSIFIDQEAEL